MLRKTLLATALLGATAFSIASAAPLGPQATFGTDGGLVTHAKSKGPGNFNSPPKTFNAPSKFKVPTNPPKVVFPPKIKVPTNPPVVVFPPKPLPPPKQPPPKGGKNRPVILGGGVVVLGGGGASCDATVARCASLFGTRTYSYRRCLRRAGC